MHSWFIPGEIEPTHQIEMNTRNSSLRGGDIGTHLDLDQKTKMDRGSLWQSFRVI